MSNTKLTINDIMDYLKENEQIIYKKISTYTESSSYSRLFNYEYNVYFNKDVIHLDGKDSRSKQIRSTIGFSRSRYATDSVPEDDYIYVNYKNINHHDIHDIENDIEVPIMNILNSTSDEEQFYNELTYSNRILTCIELSKTYSLNYITYAYLNHGELEYIYDFLQHVVNEGLT